MSEHVQDNCSICQINSGIRISALNNDCLIKKKQKKKTKKHREITHIILIPLNPTFI